LEYGPGLIYNGGVYSYADSRSRIVLCPGQREEATLMHEVTHALRGGGDVSHGPRFVSLYFRLLIEEDIASLEELTVAATRHRIDPKWMSHFEKGTP
jgi:hypothetical protein